MGMAPAKDAEHFNTQLVGFCDDIQLIDTDWRYQVILHF